MNNKRFKCLNGFWKSIFPVKGRKKHNFTEGIIQTATDKEEKILFFFEKPNKSSNLHQKAGFICQKKNQK